jgi:hypothetical protein
MADTDRTAGRPARASRWRRLARDEMEGYDFEMLERSEGGRWAQVVYDYGAAEHPRGEEPTMENIDEFVQMYPAGYYWYGVVQGEPLCGCRYGGPFGGLRAAKADADRWLGGDSGVATA